MTQLKKTRQGFKILGVILAGGASRRMGGKDKALITWQKQSFINQVYGRLAVEVDEVCISSNRLPNKQMSHKENNLKIPDLTIIPDNEFFLQGPMAGIYNAACYAQKKGYTHLFSAPVDTPYFPQDLVTKLVECATTAELKSPTNKCIFIPRFRQNKLFLHQLMPISLTHQLLNWLESGGRAVKECLNQVGYEKITYPDNHPNDNSLFYNINTPEEYADFQNKTHQSTGDS